MADCAIGTDLMAANCCYAVNNLHCDTGAHQVGLQHAFNDGQCTYDVHFPCGTPALKPLSLCGCDGDYLCPNCDRIQFDIRGHFGTVAVYGVCADYCDQARRMVGHDCGLPDPDDIQYWTECEPVFVCPDCDHQEQPPWTPTDEWEEG